jgi:hypothetical protein
MIYPEDGGSRFLWDTYIYLPNYKVSHPRRPQYSLLWELEIAYIISWFSVVNRLPKLLHLSSSTCLLWEYLKSCITLHFRWSRGHNLRRDSGCTARDVTVLIDDFTKHNQEFITVEGSQWLHDCFPEMNNLCIMLNFQVSYYVIMCKFMFLYR